MIQVRLGFKDYGKTKLTLNNTKDTDTVAINIIKSYVLQYSLDHFGLWIDYEYRLSVLSEYRKVLAKCWLRLQVTSRLQNYLVSTRKQNVSIHYVCWPATHNDNGKQRWAPEIPHSNLFPMGRWFFFHSSFTECVWVCNCWNLLWKFSELYLR